jgi:NAD(P)H-flavin reductase
MNYKKEQDMELYLIYGNKTKNDFLLNEDLEGFKNILNLKIKNVIEVEEGFISSEHISEMLPKHDDLLIIVCGSKQMAQIYISPLLLSLNYKKDNICLL